MDKKTPAASVILCVYNGRKYIDLAIESILAQTFTDFELILIDDGSADNSLERLRYYESIDKRCRVYTGPNKGMVASLNQGIDLARANIIFRMDNDDVSRPDRFEKQLNYLDQHPECVVLGTKVLLIDDEGLPIAETWDETDHDKIDSVHMSGAGTCMCHPSLVYRKSDILKIGGYRDECHYAEDLDLLLRFAEIGKLANLPEVLLEYRQHVDSVGYSKREKQVKATIRAVNDAKIRRGLPLSTDLEEIRGSKINVPTISDIYLKWGWWAFLGKNKQTAKKYAIKAFLTNPFKFETIQLIYSVYFK